MNRIILIGNGFDLAHGLKTLYKDFIETLSMDSISGNRFLERLRIIVSLRNWVDIEEEYYQQLIEFAKDNQNEQAEQINKDLSQIKQKLESYLTEIQKQQITPNKKLFFQIYSPLHIEDFIEHAIPTIRDTYKALCETEKQKEFDRIFDWILNNDIKHCTKKDYDDYVSGIHGIGLYPQNVCFLNFNYTDTEKHYQLIAVKDTLNTNFHHYNQSKLWLDMCAKRKIIHIHGELKKENNPMIFGYGDELAGEYKEIEKLNDNEYLKNVKSINYLQTDNYKQTLGFINSDYYQVFILGHSCGSSDKTLLNTLFEHKNCVSIKPFYHKKTDGTDNYEEIVMNISRIFSDKMAFREKVVNKRYCEPLIQNEDGVTMSLKKNQ